MQHSSYLESGQRGTPDFPVEYYPVDKNHPRYYMQFHWHSDIEIIHISKGRLNLVLNGRHFVMEEGESLVIPGGIVHGGTPEDCVYECLVFSKSLLYAAPKIKKLIKTKFIHPVKFKESPAVNKLFKMIADGNDDNLRQISLLFEIIGETISMQRDSDTVSEEKIERVKPAIMYIEDNYAQHITVEDMATECHMSNNYFIKYFKEVTNQTPVEFLNKFRIEAACEMLLSGGSVTETAFACGFNDLSYFIHVFKKNIGVSPKKYAEKG